MILPTAWVRDGLPRGLKGLNDSKQLTEAQREDYFAFLNGCADVFRAVAPVEADEIDRINILQATHHAMKLAVAQLAARAEHLLVDGRPVPVLGANQTALVKGDSRSYSIAAASVLAKVTRDRLMFEFDRAYPAYGFAAHKGYGTPEHLRQLAANGPCAIHRRSFAPIRQPDPHLFAHEPLAATQATPRAL